MSNIRLIARLGTPHKIPHIGWPPIEPGHASANWAASILDGLSAGSSCYFLHSYMAGG